MPTSPPRSLSGQVIIVTGAGAGIGLATARRLIAEGARVVLASLESEEALRPVLDSLTGDAQYVQTDVRLEADVQRLIDRAVTLHGRIDGLVNNAGVTVQRDFLEVSVADFDDLIATNLRSVFLCSQRAARVMQGHGGVIVNIASNHAARTLPRFDIYAATKGGIVSLTRAMAWSLGPLGIRVLTVSPGLTIVERLQNWLDHDPQGLQHEQHYREAHASGHSNTPDDVAGVIAFALSSAARGMTGSELLVDNGMSALLFRDLRPAPTSPNVPAPGAGDLHEDH